MATTTNFGWETPDDTDLVKDGALAIRTLGSAIDTSLVDLKGGTTGQVLSKTSNTDMDFTWVTSDDANAIQNTIVDAKGDLISASAADVPARLAVGNNGETLVADSSTSTGLRWQGSQVGGKNGLINGGFDIWQRGTSLSLSTFSYGADRWNFWRLSGSSGVTLSQGTGLTGSQFSAKLQRNSGQTFTDSIWLVQDIETSESYRFAGKTVTFSFYIRKGANYSGGDITAVIRSGTGTNQLTYNGYTGGANVASTTATIASTTTYQRVTLTGTVSSSATQLGVYINYTPSGTAGANDFIEVSQAQLEIGSVATEFSPAGGTLAGELAACQRYYQRYNVDSDGFAGFAGTAYSTTAVAVTRSALVPFRVTPTAIDYSGVNLYDNVNAAYAITGLTIWNAAESHAPALLATGATGLTQFRYYNITSSGGSGYIGLSAEL